MEQGQKLGPELSSGCKLMPLTVTQPPRLTDCHTLSCSAHIEPLNLHPMSGRLYQSIELGCEVTFIYCPCLKASLGWACDVMCGPRPEACRGWAQVQ